MNKKHSSLQTPLSPAIYHLADAANWSSIQQYGLLSTSALLDLSRVEGKEREQLEQRQRTRQITLSNGTIIGGQNPMPPAALERCLQGMTPYEWYALLNARVFFWLDIGRLNRMQKANHHRAQVVMVLDTEQLLASYAEQTTLTPINTGNARRKPALRGKQTFVPYNTWVESRWNSEAEALGTPVRPGNHSPAELTIAGAVPDVMKFVKNIAHLKSGEIFSLA